MTASLRFTDADGSKVVTPDGFRYTPASGRRTELTTETLILYFDGISASRSELSTLNQLITQAEHRWRGNRARDPVYIEFKPDGDSDYYRSEIITGEYDHHEEQIGPVLWGSDMLIMSLTITRMPFWEGPETEVGLDNAGGSSYATGGLTIYNHNDGTHENSVKLDPSDLDGDMPAPIKVRINHDQNTTTARWFVGLNAYGDADVDDTAEGEDGNSAESTSTTVEATCSNGYYRTVTWTGDTQKAIWYYQLTTDQLNDFAGGWYRGLMRFQDQPASGLALQMYLCADNPLISSDYIIGQTEEVYAQQERLVDLGALQLPPVYQSQPVVTPGISGLLIGMSSPTTFGGGSEPLYVVLAARLEGGSSLKVDFIQFQGTDGYADVRWAAGALSVTEDDALVVDDIANQLYMEQATTNYRLPAVVRHGSALMVEPGQANTLTVLTRGASATMSISEAYTVKVWYRPRRLTI